MDERLRKALAILRGEINRSDFALEVLEGLEAGLKKVDDATEDFPFDEETNELFWLAVDTLDDAMGFLRAVTGNLEELFQYMTEHRE